METVGNILEALPPALGDNKPPILEVLKDELEVETIALIRRRDELLAAAGRMPDKVSDDEEAGKFSDMTKLVAACIKNAEAARVSKKEVFLAAGRAVDGHYKKLLTDPLLKAKASIEDRLGVFLRAKAAREKAIRDRAERVAREAAQKAAEEARKAAEAMQNQKDLDEAMAAQQRAQDAAAASVAASKAAAAKPAEMARTRGDVGSLATLQTFWDFDPLTLSRAELDLEALRQHLPTDALDKAIRSFIKAGGRALRGVRIFENQKARVS